MKILVGCEYSGTVRDAFARLGHDAWSCDLLPSETEGNHLQMDVLDSVERRIWDLIILHPPCTAIAICGNSTYGKRMPKNSERVTALAWTRNLWDEATRRCKHVALENPKNVLGAVIGKKTQSIHPWQYGHPEQKETWLWLHGLPPLMPTDDVYDEMMLLPKKQRERLHYMSPSANRGKERARFFKGWADAMATQWGNL